MTGDPAAEDPVAGGPATGDSVTGGPAAEDPTIPSIGFGTAPMDDAQTELAVADALAAGYRLIDTAAAYGNEAGVGRAIAATAVPRAEVLVITKLPGRSHGYEATLTSFEESRRRLGLSYLDFYLIHWPLPSLDAYVESWRALIHLRSRDLVRHIGVSNFLPAHITRLIEETGVAPAVNQVELHPGFPQAELRAFHDAHGIRTLAYSPLGRGPAGLGADLLGGDEIASVARVHGVTPAQAVLRWHIQLRSVPLTRTSSLRRRRENLDVFGFTLTPDEMDRITGNPPYTRVGFDPATHMECLSERVAIPAVFPISSPGLRGHPAATGRPATDRSTGGRSSRRVLTGPGSGPRAASMACQAAASSTRSSAMTARELKETQIMASAARTGVPSGVVTVQA